MFKLIKYYPSQPYKTREVWNGDLETVIVHLNEIEARIKRRQLSEDGTVFTKVTRIDELNLETSIRNIVNADVGIININYSIK